MPSEEFREGTPPRSQALALDRDVSAGLPEEWQPGARRLVSRRSPGGRALSAAACAAFSAVLSWAAIYATYFSYLTTVTDRMILYIILAAWLAYWMLGGTDRDRRIRKGFGWRNRVTAGHGDGET
jgi:hypothetical protein